MKLGLRLLTTLSITVLVLCTWTGIGYAQAVDTDTADVGLEVSNSCANVTVAPSPDQEAGDSNQVAAEQDSCPTPTIPPTPSPTGVPTTPSPTSVPATSAPTLVPTTPTPTSTVPTVNQLPETGSGTSAVGVSIIIVTLSTLVVVSGTVLEIRHRS